jgi:hypothetical protein
MLNFKSRKETCMGLLLVIDGTLRLTFTSGRVHCNSLWLYDYVKNCLPCGGISRLPNNIKSANSPETSVIFLFSTRWCFRNTVVFL